MALIDRGRVMADYLENLGRKDSYKAKFEALCKAVDEAPAVDAVPVVHARWIHGVTLGHECRKCSECLVSQNIFGCFTYRPNCGAKMDGGASYG